MSEEKRLSSEFAIAASRASALLGIELRGAFDDLKTSAPQYVEQAIGIERKAAGYIADGLSGKIDPDIAKEAAKRENEALEFLARKALEERAQAALKRVKRAIDISIDVGLTLAKTAITVGVAAI